MIRAVVRFDPQVMLEGVERHKRAHTPSRVIAALRVLVIVVLVAAAAVLVWNRQFGMAAVLALLAIPVALVNHSAKKSLLKNAEKSPFLNRVYTYEADNDSFHGYSDQHDSRLDWSMLTQAVHFRDGFLLYYGPGMYSWIPVAALEHPDQVSELEALLREKIVDHKVIAPVAAPPAG